MPEQICESLVGTTNSAMLHREILRLDVENYVEDMMCGNGGAVSQHGQREGRKQCIERDRIQGC